MLYLYFTFIFTLVRSTSITVVFMLTVVICDITRAIIVPIFVQLRLQKCLSLRTSSGTGVSITSTKMINILNPTKPAAFFYSQFLHYSFNFKLETTVNRLYFKE